MEGQELLSQLTSAAVVVYVMQWLKRSPLVAFISQETKVLNRVLSGLGAALSAIGIHFAFDTSAAQAGTYVITITGVSLLAVAHGCWHWLNAVALQQLVYDAAVSHGEAHDDPPSGERNVRGEKL